MAVNERLSLRYEDGEIPPFAFCESIHATGRSPWHIRRIDPNIGLRLGGGIDSASLCTSVARGWDLEVRISALHLKDACPRCVAAYKRETGT